MSKSYQDTGLPSYTEALDNDPLVSRASPEKQLRDRVTIAQVEHVDEVVAWQIYPLLKKRAAHGMAKSVIALIPCAAENEGGSVIGRATNGGRKAMEADTATDSEEEKPNILNIVGFLDRDDVQQIQLTSSLDTPAFWRQPEVLSDLQHQVSIRVATDLQSRPPPVDPSYSLLPTRSPLLEQKKPVRRGLFGWRTSSAPSILEEFKPSSSADSRNDFKPSSVREGTALATGYPLPSRVTAEIQDITFRTQTPFGLYETTTKVGVVLRVDAS